MAENHPRVNPQQGRRGLPTIDGLSSLTWTRDMKHAAERGRVWMGRVISVVCVCDCAILSRDRCGLMG